MLTSKFSRVLPIAQLVQKKSLFLFGPRSTGKTTLLRNTFSPDSIINLLRSTEYLALAENPGRFRDRVREISSSSQVIIVDEIQKLPILLDEIHDLIETTDLHFILTGSSGRKLKNSGVNLLAGRAWQANLFPLVSDEIPEFDIYRYLQYGGLPQVWTSNDPDEELEAYINTYLKEEVKEEALVQNIAHFARFLRTASLCNAQQLNYANISRDSGVPVTSVRAWFEILEDTFLGFTLEPWQGSVKRKAVASAKFYFFDVGVANFLAEHRQLNRNSTEFGLAFEHFIAMELRAWISYRRERLELTYWRSQNGIEVDFLLGTELAIEVKASTRIHDADLKGLRALKEEGKINRFCLVSFEEQDSQTKDGIRRLFWRSFLRQLWEGSLIT